jgi:hypothetical protein
MSNTIALSLAIEPTAEVVVQNDIANEASITPLSVAQPLTRVLADLETQRVVWEEGVYRTSNQALYALLAHCLVIAQADTPELAKQRNAGLEAFYKLRGYSYKKDAPPATRVLKAVFSNIDRRRLSTYSLVLREAIKQRVQATQLADWIEREGGVQAIRLSQSATFVKPAAKVEQAKQTFDTLPELGTLKSEALSLLADGNYLGECCVLVAEQAADGSFVVRGLTRAGGAVNAAFAALYSEQKKSA